MKHHKLISFITIVLISNIITGIAYAYGSSICFLTNPPDTIKEWTFFGGKSVHVYLENISNQYAFVILHSSTGSELYTIPAKDMTSSTAFYNFTATTTTVQWHFSISCTTTGSQIVGHAYWN